MDKTDHTDRAEAELRAEAQRHETHFTVDGEECATTQKELTPNYIIREYGKRDPATNYLVAIKGTQKVSYQGKGDEAIKVHEHEAFQIVSTGPTPVSQPTGPAAFAEGLRALGYEPKALPGLPDHLLFDYRVEIGRFVDQSVRLGFIVPPDFPTIPPGGPHVSPRLCPLHPANDLPHPNGGVHQSHSAKFEEAAEGEWQYWSRPCSDWAKGKKTVSAYMAHIWRLWETQ